MRALVLLAGLAAGCRAAPAWEPIGGFELVPAPDTWHDVEPRELADWLAEARARLASMRDYAAVLETRERIEDDVHPRRVLAVRVRERPFSACIETREPENERGQ